MSPSMALFAKIKADRAATPPPKSLLPPTPSSRKPVVVVPVEPEPEPEKKKKARLTLHLKKSFKPSNDTEFEADLTLTPREVYIRNNAIIKMQKLFRGRKGREWCDNQAMKQFPLRAPVNKNFLVGGSEVRSKGIFLERKRFLLERSIDAINVTKENWEAEQDKIVKLAEDKDRWRTEKRADGGLEGFDANATINSVKDILMNNKVSRRLDAEALMLHKNLRYMASCIIQHFCRQFILTRYPKLIGVLRKKQKIETARVTTALFRNNSRKASTMRREERIRKAGNKFVAIPLIVKMQRDWREYLKIKHGKSEMGKAIRLIKRMREDRKAGQEFFRKLRQDHRDEIGLAVDYNLKLRHKAILHSFETLAANALERRKRKAWLLDKVQRRMAAVLYIWFKEIMQKKRNVANKIRPNLFPPLLGEVMRFMNDNDWTTFLVNVSEMFTEFDKHSVVRSLQYEEFITNKVIGFNVFPGGLNEMLTYHVAQSQIRKRVNIIPRNEKSFTIAFWDFLHQVSLYLFEKARELALR